MWKSIDTLTVNKRVILTNGDIVKEGYLRPDGIYKYGRNEDERWDRLSITPPTHWMDLPKPI